MKIETSGRRLAALSLCFALAACGGDDGGGPAPESPSAGPPALDGPPALEPGPSAGGPSAFEPPPIKQPPALEPPPVKGPPALEPPPVGGPPAGAAPPVAGNTAPTISGSPSSAVVYDTLYRFAPDAYDADGDSLRFSVRNAPPWAVFEPSSGLLAGVPGEEHIGHTYEDVTITVTDGLHDAALDAFSIRVEAWADGAIELTWAAPTENTDGSPLTNLAGFRIHWGTSSGDYTETIVINSPGLDRYVLDGLVPNTYYFVATAVNTEGDESEYSEEAVAIVT